MIFDNLKVLELASVLAGPSVGQFFGELGAEVIKIENLKTSGDVTRTWKIAGESEGDLSAYFTSVNWAKKSIAIDLSHAEGKGILMKMAIDADIIIASYKPGDAEKLGVDYDSISRLNPRIIYGEITGYGSANDRVGYDAVIQAEAGFMDLNGEKDGQPVKMPVALMDLLAGHHLKEGLLVALLKRASSGTGERVQVSLIQAAIASLVNQASNWLVAKKLPRRQGSAHPNIAPYGDTFQTADSKTVLLAVGSDKQFRSLCSVLEIEDLAVDDHFLSNKARVENRLLLNDRIAERIARMESSHFLSRANALKIPAGIIRNVKEVLETSEARALILQGRGLEGVSGYAVASERKDHILPPPHFGEHTVEVLKSIGYDAISIQKLAGSGIIK